MFARSLGEFGAIVFVSGNIPNKTLTAPVLITQLIGAFKTNDAAARPPPSPPALPASRSLVGADN